MAKNTDVMRVTDPILGNLTIRPDARGGKMALARAKVTLEAGLDYHAFGGSKDGAKAIMAAPGIQKLNQIASISTLTPSTVVVNGTEQGNPYCERDSDGNLLRVVIRKLMVGFSKFGERVCSDYTCDFDIEGYHRRDLLAVVKSCPKAAMMLPAGQDAPGPERTWLRVPIGSGVDIWVDLASAEVRKVFDTTAQRRQFGLRTATTICVRNGLAQHPAIGGMSFMIPSKEKKGSNGGSYYVADVPKTHDVEVYYFRPEADSTEAQLVDMAQQVGGGKTLGILKVDRTIEDRGSVDPEEVATAMLESGDGDGREAPEEDQDHGNPVEVVVGGMTHEGLSSETAETQSGPEEEAPF